MNEEEMHQWVLSSLRLQMLEQENKVPSLYTVWYVPTFIPLHSPSDFWYCRMMWQVRVCRMYVRQLALIISACDILSWNDPCISSVYPLDVWVQGHCPIRRLTWDSNLVDSASSIRLSQRLSHACLSINDYTVKLRMAHYISYSFFDGSYYLDNRSNSRANTCIKPRLLEGVYLLDWNQCGVTRIMVIHNNFRIDLSMHHSSFCPISFGW